MSKPGLEPCPFCGNTAICILRGPSCMVFCDLCSASIRINVVKDEAKSLAEVIDKWNRRASDGKS